MPIYEYQCKQCGSHFEKRQSVSDGPLTKCEKCGGELEKQWSLSGFQFKGEGWYVTDYAGKKGAGSENAPSTGTTPTGGETKEKSSGGESTTAADIASKPKVDSGSTTKTDGGSSKA
ncbi:MAG TPA: zinc ribbon domain-containing protein [Pyrinomonadaceae bacterium]|nr:zinc ribbon domain-containing protein [Pyrinomonadaceae bacterium]